MVTGSTEPINIDETGDVIVSLQNSSAVFAVWEAQEQDSCHDGTFEEPILYRVSSRHLINASAKFRSELSGSWVESRKSEDGLYHLATSDWDSEAFGILLRVLYLRHRQVPKTLNLEMLAKVAVLVDYYRCWEAFDLFSDLWVANVRESSPVPPGYGRDLMLWMIISWVFKLQYEFETTTRRAIKQSTETDIRDLELGIPPAILTAMKERRIESIEEIISICYDYIDKFCLGLPCTHSNKQFACNSMLLGGLMKGMKQAGLMFPRPEAPFIGSNLEGVYKLVRGFREPSVGQDQVHRDPCSLKSSVFLRVDGAFCQVAGFDLEHFKDRAEETDDSCV